MGSGVFSFLSVFHAQCVNRAGVCECIVALCTYSGFNREEIFRPGVFLFMLGSKRTVCGRRRLGRYPILRLTSSLRCVPGEARRRGGLRRSQSAERLQACRGARCSVSDWAAGGVCARRRGEAEGRLLLRGAGCIVERSACTWCCMMCVQAGCQAVQQTEQMSARARARAGACVRARLAWCRICVVLAARPGTAACEMPEAVCRACTGRKKAR